MKMDETWAALGNEFTDIEDFKKKYVPDIFLKPQVHKDVVENFRVIKKLIEHSYFEYQFYDVATLKSTITLEMALKLRYREINSEKWDKNKPLVQLITWFQERNYFEVYYDEYLDIMRGIRNSLAHPSELSFSGPFSRHIIENILDLINGLYEDPQLRKKRMETTTELIDKLKSFGNGVKCVNGNTSYFAFNIWPGFINNKATPTQIHLYFNPTYEIPESRLEYENLILPPVIHFKGDTLKFSTKSIMLKNDDKPLLIVSPINTAGERQQFDEWMTKYEYYCKPGYGYIYPKGNIVDTFTMHLRQFHKI